MRRREFIKLIGGTTLIVRGTLLAQAADRTRRIGVLMNVEADEPLGQSRMAAFLDGLQAPIVFANVIDPVGAGFVTSLARPSGNITGFSVFEYSISGKWLELLKELSPKVARVAVLRDSGLAAGIGQFAAIQAMAPRSLELTLIDMRDRGEIERALTVFAREPNSGLIVTASPQAIVYRDLIISLATRYRLPNIYPFRYYPENGGLASYGPDPKDEYRRSAAYVDRILKGEIPANLPVQAPTKYELIINLKTAKTLGLEMPPSLLARADEVIE